MYLIKDDIQVLDTELIPFLEGVVVGGDNDTARDAQSLIWAIKTYGKIRIFIE